jgi:hypothetical protein
MRRAALIAAALAAGCTNHPGVSPWDEPRDFNEPPPADFGFTPNTAAGPGEEGYRCGGKSFETRAGEGQILLVLDRSGSMKGKWPAVTGALLQTVKETQSKVAWGLLGFPDQKGAACSVSDTPDVPIASMNLTAVSDAMTAMVPGDPPGSPVRLAIKKAAAQLAALPSKDPKYIVLATDGAPNCRDDMPTGVYDAEPSIAAIRDAAAAGFHTFVIGIASGAADEGVLSDLAVAGLESVMTGTRKYYYASADTSKLAAILKVITTRLLDCVFPLEAAPPAPDIVKVTVDGERFSRDTTHTEGWDYLPGNTSIQLFGSACRRLQQQDGPRGVVQIAFGCPREVIP